MKKREITNKDLGQLFGKITEQAPLMSEEQVDVLLTNFAAAKTGDRTTRFFRNHINSLLLGAVLVIVASVFIWINIDKDAVGPIVQNQVQENPSTGPLSDTLVIEQHVDSCETINEQVAVKDSVAKEPVKQPTLDSIAVDTISLETIYQQVEKKPQVFSISANKDTTITCKEGTTIKIAANSFVSGKTGAEITGKIEISVKEYYKLSDIILANLTTTSGSKILETGGMLNVTAKSSNEKCAIKSGCSVEIGFPNTSRKYGMALFYGERNADKIDWKLADTSKSKNPETFFIVEAMPEFPGGQPALRKFIYDNLRYPINAMENGIQGQVLVNFIVDEEGNIYDATVTRSINRSLDKEALRVVNSFPRWTPGIQKGKPVRVSYTIPFVFELSDGDLAASNENFEEKVKGDNFRNVTASDVSRYVFNATQLGWLNCDRFYNSTGSVTEYSIPIGVAEEINVNMVFQRFQAVIPCIVASDRAIFDCVPLGEKVTIVALKTLGSKVFLAVRETEITSNGELELIFQPVAMNLLKKEIEKLNQFDE